jgi:hypothetical protein
MSIPVQSNNFVTLPAPAAPAPGTYTVLASDSGKTLLIPIQSQVIAVSLPPSQAGLHYRFMAIGILAFAVTITPSVANTITGTLINTTAAPAIAFVAKSDSANVQFTGNARIGDWVDMNCDGNIWYVSGISSVAGGLA